MAAEAQEDPAMKPMPEVLKVAEVAKLLRMGVRQTYEAIYRGEIEGCHRIGSQVRCSAVAIRQRFNLETSPGAFSPTEQA